jgi:hypothetical protein
MSLTMREKHRLRLLEDALLRKTFGPKKDTLAKESV